MAAFASFSAAETRAVTLVANGTWVNAHAARRFDGTVVVRVQRFMSPTNPDHGSWVEIDQDDQV